VNSPSSHRPLSTPLLLLLLWPRTSTRHAGVHAVRDLWLLGPYSPSPCAVCTRPSRPLVYPASGLAAVLDRRPADVHLPLDFVVVPATGCAPVNSLYALAAAWMSPNVPMCVFLPLRFACAWMPPLVMALSPV
jgi:hypothetical protein